jgi:signal transduction histidine kinase
MPVVWADHDRLEQIFVNLLENATRHNPAATRVVVEATTAGEGTVRITVTDDGVGIPPEVSAAPVAARVERRSRGSGAGLGLSIARGIIGAHGGALELERLDPGTRCTVTLPVALGAPAADIASDRTGEGDADTDAPTTEAKGTGH